MKQSPHDKLGQISFHLWGLVIPVLIGAATGAALFFALRQARLRWTWALLGVPLAYLLWFVQWHLGLAVAVATATALYLGVKSHDEALQHGGEEARAIRDSLGPLRWVWAKTASRRATKNRVRKGHLTIGISSRGGPCRVPIGNASGVHSLISGATGSGKTVCEASASQAYILNGAGGETIAPKYDALLRDTQKAAAEHMGVAFLEWSPTGPLVYNPFARGGPSEIVDKILSGQSWTEPHYEMATHRQLGQVLATMKAAGLWPPTMSEIVAHMDTERLDHLASKVGGQTEERVHAYVDSLSERAKADLGGGRDRLAALAESEIGPWLDPALGAGETLDVAAALRRGDVVYFNLEADRYPKAAALLGSALIVDLIGLTAEHQRNPLGAFLLIDEFAALSAEQVSQLFARARSAGLSIMLGTQSPADLRAARPEDRTGSLAAQVLANISYAVIHRIGDPESAELFAETAGTDPSWSVTQRIGGKGAAFGVGEGTRTREREFLVGPDQFKRLRIGQAVVINPAVKHPAQVVQILPPIPPEQLP